MKISIQQIEEIMSLPRFASTCLAALALAACNGVPIATQWKLRNFRPDTADFSQFRFAARLPVWMTPTPDTAKAIVSHSSLDNPADKRTLHLRLAPATTHPEDAKALVELANSAGLAVFEVDRRDLAPIRAEQEAARALKSGDEKRKGDLTLDHAACRDSEVPTGPIPLDVYLHPSDEIGWVTLLEGANLRALTDNAPDFEKVFAEHVPLCGKPMNRASR